MPFTSLSPLGDHEPQGQGPSTADRGPHTWPGTAAEHHGSSCSGEQGGEDPGPPGGCGEVRSQKDCQERGKWQKRDGR